MIITGAGNELGLNVKGLPSTSRAVKPDARSPTATGVALVGSSGTAVPARAPQLISASAVNTFIGCMIRSPHLAPTLRVSQIRCHELVACRNMWFRASSSISVLKVYLSLRAFALAAAGRVL